VTIPSFAEAHHQLVRSVQHYSDRELVCSYRQEPQQAKFFVALFCRYSSITYSIIQHVAGDRIQIDYLFALAWQRVFDRLEHLEDSEINTILWQNWIVNTAGELVNEEHLIVPTNQINYRLHEVSPPLRCYVEHSLNLMQPLLRLVFMMSERWHWSTTKIADQLQAEGEDISEMDVPLYISESQKAFTKTLPTDLLDIYRSTSNILAEESLDIDTLGNIIVSQSSISVRN
jgi:hypothetical protein